MHTVKYAYSALWDGDVYDIAKVDKCFTDFT